MNRNDPRMIALDALMACLVEGKPLDETLECDRRMEIGRASCRERV